MSYTLTAGDAKCSIEIFLPEASEAPHTTLIADRPEISYGADDIDNESVFFPGSCKIQLYSNFAGLFDYLYHRDCRISVYENDEYVFTGYIDMEDIELSLSDGILSLTFVDNSRALKIIPVSELTELEGHGNMLFQDIIQLILDRVDVDLQWDVPGSYIEAESEYTTVGGLERMGIPPFLMLTGSAGTALEVLNHLLISLGLIGYFTADKFVVKPRFTTVSAIPLTPDNLGDDAEISPVSDSDQIKFWVKESDLEGTWAPYIVSDTRLDPSQEAKNLLEYWIYFPGGWPSAYNYNPIVLKDTDYEIFYQTTESSFSVNGSARSDLVQLFGGLIADRCAVVRRKLKGSTRIRLGLFDILSHQGKNYVVTEIDRLIGEDMTDFHAISI